MPLNITPSRPVRGAPITVERLVLQRRLDPDSGAHPLPIEEHESSGVHSGIITGDALVSELEVAPIIPLSARKPASALQRWLGFSATACSFILVCVFFADSSAEFFSRLSKSTATARWRDLPISILSTPRNAAVFVQDQARGTAPAQLVEPCRGRHIRIRVQAPGYAIWEWSGICPYDGQLALQAHLRPL